MVRRHKSVQKLAKQEDMPEFPSSKGGTNVQVPTAEEVFEEEVGVVVAEKGFDPRDSGLPSKETFVQANDLGSMSWPEEVDARSFQDSAKEIWARFRESLPSYGCTKLHFMEPIQKDGQLVAKLDVDEIEVEASFWKSALICVVIGANPPLAVFEGFIKRIWGKLGIECVARMNAGFIMVKFRDEATLNLVLESGVIHFDKKPIVLRPWTTNIDSLKSVKSVPVWIRLPDLGLQYWGVKCLSALVSTIGKPIMIDKTTKDRSMIKFAQVLVDMEIAETLPQYINYLNERGQVMEQPIEYEWLPTKCSNCKKLGHTVSTCKFVSEVAWRKKESKSKPKIDPSGVEEIVVLNSSDPMSSSSIQQLQLGLAQPSERPKEQNWSYPKRSGVLRPVE
ncbi:uncharacterized protein LOC133825252 [Humulus lupulus]|uniref:uncharacterized protein LOC133825252 n=1 Tax=Humulus lupulus TaxID=3486 RepID=UPI002B40D2EB|nr:uncharacterized protein LOC133825252 [Humulus lupulus]